MIKQLEKLLDTIDILCFLIREYKEDHKKCLCPMTRQKIAWEWNKAVALKKIRQKEALELADQIIPDINSILS